MTDLKFTQFNVTRSIRQMNKDMLKKSKRSKERIKVEHKKMQQKIGNYKKIYPLQKWRFSKNKKQHTSQ